MKKFVTLMACVILGLTCLTGCTKNDEPFTQKNYTAESDDIREITVEVRDRQIEVALSNDDNIHIDYFENNKEYYDISVSDNHTLTMTAVSDKEWTDYIGGKSAANSRKILLQVPDAHLAALEISTTNEDISLPPLTVIDHLSLIAHGGNIVFGQLKVGKSIYLDAKNGDISGTLMGSYDDYAISCNIKKGESNLPSSKENGVKTLTVVNNNGDINVEFD